MKIVVVGPGSMGSAFVGHFAKAHDVVTCGRHDKKASLIKGAEIVLLAVKPKDLAAVSKEIGPLLTKEQILISMLAGVTLDTLRTHFPSSHLLRIMPNLALICNEGVIGIVDDQSLPSEQKKKIDTLFHGLGLLSWVPESKINAISALAGSGPAFMYLIIEAMIEGGIYMGLTADQSKEYTLQMIKGSIELLQFEGKTPTELTYRIASPAGTTIAGLKKMEEDGVRGCIINALIETYKKN